MGHTHRFHRSDRFHRIHAVDEFAAACTDLARIVVIWFDSTPGARDAFCTDARNAWDEPSVRQYAMLAGAATADERAKALSDYWMTEKAIRIDPDEDAVRSEPFMFRFGLGFGLGLEHQFRQENTGNSDYCKTCMDDVFDPLVVACYARLAQLGWGELVSDADGRWNTPGMELLSRALGAWSCG